METSPTLYALLIIFLLILAVLWCLLPFAVFGIKGKLDRAIKLADEMNLRMASIERAIRNQPDPPPQKEEVYDC